MPAKSDVIGAEELGRTLAALGSQGLAAAAGALRREAERIMTDSKENYVPVDLGTIRASGFVQEPTMHGSRLTVTMGYGGPAKKYAVYVHEGTGPAVGRPAFMPPVSALRKWAKRHGIPEEAAFAVARAIGRRGLAPLKYLEIPLNIARRGMDARIAEDVRRDLERTAGGRR